VTAIKVLLARTRHHRTPSAPPRRTYTTHHIQQHLVPRSLAGESMLGYFFSPPPLTDIEALGAQISSQNRPSRAYKRAGPAPHLVPHLHHQFPLLPELSIATTSAARAVPGCRPPAAVDIPPQSVPDQGEERNELPSTSSSFCPTSRLSLCTRSPAPLPPSTSRPPCLLCSVS
jgi:hypothetical protein